jgi:hypothetical protein
MAFLNREHDFHMIDQRILRKVPDFHVWQETTINPEAG